MKLTYQKNCVRMSLKTHYLFDHLDIFQSSRGYNEQKSDNFHNEMNIFENMFKGHHLNMIDYT